MSDDMIDVTDFDTEMEIFACHLMKAAQKDKITVEDKVKVFNAIQPYHEAREKYKSASKLGGKNGARSFGQFKAGVKAAPTPEQ